jgi:hypothetical protein
VLANPRHARRDAHPGLYRALAAVKRTLTLFAAHLALTSLQREYPSIMLTPERPWINNA